MNTGNSMSIRTQLRLGALAIACILSLATSSFAQYPHPSKVDIQWNRWYTPDQITTQLKDLVKAYPKLLSLASFGLSPGGHELWVVTLNNPATGPDTSKPAMWIDGNIHGNEIQAAETVVYSIWYLTKSYGKIDAITKLVDERAFYFMPMVNPDGRAKWFYEAATPHFLRGGILPTDNDRDGVADEDGYDDLDGDGHITTMWKKDPLGRYKKDPDDDRFFIRVAQDDEPGGWTRLGSEGIDNDGDGDINEDGVGGYDPNRNWPADWQPNYIQFGAGEYPFSLKATRAIGEFLIDHPNVAAFQSYHNTGGMILRGPGADYVDYPRSDIRVYDMLQDVGVRLLPTYRKYILWTDLYVVHGGEVNFAYEGLGITAFTNELWTNRKLKADGTNPTQEEMREFRELLQFDEVYVPYTEFDHPTYGEILIGGTKKWSSRLAPPWLQEEDCHRNFAFTMFHAAEMPLVEWGLESVRALDGNLWEVTVQVKNPKIIPSITAMARQHRIGQPDRLTCEGATVVASGTVSSVLPNARLNPVEHRPERIQHWNGIGSHGSQLFRFIVEGSGEVKLTYASQKGGTIKKTVTLEATP